jgi:hypothetical protein
VNRVAAQSLFKLARELFRTAIAKAWPEFAPISYNG